MKSKGLLLALAVAGTVFGFALPAAAVPLAYDEAVSGDIDPAISILGNVDVGTNTIAGSILGEQGDCDSNDCRFSDMSGDKIDAFRVGTPGALEITEVRVDISNFVVNDANAGVGFFNTSLSFFGFFSDDLPFLRVLATPTTGTPIFTIQADRMIEGNGDGSISFDYVFTLT